MSSLTDLPVELLVFIIERTDSIKSLHTLASSCRLINSVAHNRLYHLGREAALAWGATQGKVDTVRHALNAAPVGLSVEALKRAAEHGHVDVVTELVSHEQFRRHLVKPPSARRGFCPVYIASAAGHLDVVRAFLSIDGLYVDKPSGRHDCAPLFGAVRNNKTDVLALLLDAGADPNLFRVPERSPLQVAAGNGFLDAARLLLEAGAKPDLTGSHSSRPLIEALKIEHFPLVRLLLEHGASPSERDSSLGTPLHIAARSCPCKFVEILLQHGADVNIANQLTDSPLSDAVQRGALDICELLLKSGVRITADADGWTPSHYAAMHGNIDMLKVFCDLPIDSHRCLEPYERLLHLSRSIEVTRFLLERGYRTDVLDTNGETPLTQLLERGSIQGPPGSFVEAVNLLLKHGADPSAKSTGGKSAVYWAIFNARSLEAVEALLAAGANVFAPQEIYNNRMLLHSVTRLQPKKSAKAAELLLDHGPDMDISALDDNRMTPIQVAVRALHVDLLRLLIERGADARATDRHGRTLLHELVDVAGEVSQSKDTVRECATVLLDAGVDQAARHSYDLTALHEAVVLGRQSLVDLFLRRGADVNAMYPHRVVNLCNQNEEIRQPFSLLHAAVARPSITILALLLEHGADVGAVDGEGRTPLHWATELQSDELVIQLLLWSGADPAAQDEAGRKALDAAPQEKTDLSRVQMIHMTVPCRYSYKN